MKIFGMKNISGKGFMGILMLLFFLVSNSRLFAQNIKGKIIAAIDGSPAAFASIKISTENNGTISDSSGKFLLHVHTLKKTDTVVISLIGYDILKIPAQKALAQSEFVLQQSQKAMETVVVRSFRNAEIAGAKSEIVGFYRSWNTNNTGGEIGRTFSIKHKEYQVAKVRFKVYSTYDTCIVRLHIREVNNGVPDRGILNDSIATVINSSLSGDKACEIDLNKYNVILSQKNIFVGLQVVNGSKPDATPHSFSFVGSEEGEYFYKSKTDDAWHSYDDYTIYMKLLLKYDD